MDLLKEVARLVSPLSDRTTRGYRVEATTHQGTVKIITPYRYSRLAGVAISFFVSEAEGIFIVTDGGRTTVDMRVNEDELKKALPRGLQYNNSLLEMITGRAAFASKLKEFLRAIFVLDAIASGVWRDVVVLDKPQDDSVPVVVYCVSGSGMGWLAEGGGGTWVLCPHPADASKFKNTEAALAVVERASNNIEAVHFFEARQTFEKMTGWKDAKNGLVR
jgi:hypothetical protein